MIFILYIVCLIYPCVSGVKDAVLWSKKGADAFPLDEHLIFIVERLTFAGCVLVAGCMHLSIMDIYVTLVCWSLAFPFFHNGFYYVGRNKIDKAYKGFFSDSVTSTSMVNFTAPLRVAMLIISILILITYETIVH
jgi:hypothetical protein